MILLSNVLISNVVNRPVSIATTKSVPNVSISVFGLWSFLSAMRPRGCLSSPQQARAIFHCQTSHALRLIVRETSFGGTKVFTLEEHANHKPLKHKSEKEFRQHCKSSLCCMQISERLLPRVSRFNLNEPTAAWSQPAIPRIFGHFIISGCSHNSDLNG